MAGNQSSLWASRFLAHIIENKWLSWKIDCMNPVAQLNINGTNMHVHRYRLNYKIWSLKQLNTILIQTLCNKMTRNGYITIAAKIIQFHIFITTNQSICHMSSRFTKFFPISVSYFPMIFHFERHSSERFSLLALGLVNL